MTQEEPQGADPHHIGVSPRLVLLRHGHIHAHRGDVPLTAVGMSQAGDAGRWFGEAGWTFEALQCSPTRRTQQTATSFADGYRETSDTALPAPTIGLGLRNPDLYLGGHVVNMTGTAGAIADQAPGVTAQDVKANAFYRDFLDAADRIGFWLYHNTPPGDDARTVGRRIDALVRSLTDVPGGAGRSILGITHSPVLRAVAMMFLGDDPGEPRHLHGYALSLRASGELRVTPITPAAGHVSDRTGHIQ